MTYMNVDEIKKLLASDQAQDIHQGLEMIRDEMDDVGDVGDEDLQDMVEMVLPLFYIDLLDHPELVPVVDEAISLVADSGQRVISLLIESLDAGDLKAQLAIGQALGRVGVNAIDPLIEAYRSTSEPERRIFILYALGKIESPQIKKALDVALSASHAENPELRDTAIRVIGKFAESIPSDQLSAADKEDILTTITDNLSDERAGVRSKAVRSYGKLAKYGHLNAEEREELTSLCHSILGSDEFNWDRAYIVRKEAREILNFSES